MIDNGGMTNDYINVNGGTLAYYGSSAVQDYFTVPVWVQKGGTFVVSTASGQPNGAKLVVQDGSQFVFPTGTQESVYMTGTPASSVQLSQEATLEADQDYYQAGGILETMDATTCKLVDGAKSNGTAIIAGGTVWIDAQGGYGELDVNASNLNFGGDLNVTILTYTPGVTQGNQDVLRVAGGNFNLNPQKASSLFVNVNGTPVGGDSWTIIYSSNITSSNPPPIVFGSLETNTGVNLNQTANPPGKQGEFYLSF